MSKEQTGNTEILFKIFLGALGLLALKAIFENDNSKIISKKGSKILTDNDVMEEFNKKVKESENSLGKDSHKEIYL